MARTATVHDKQLVVDILSEAFLKNPGALILLKRRGDKKQQLKTLITYIFYQCVNIGGVYISDNNKGVACCYKFNGVRFSLRALFWKYWFAISCIGIRNMPYVMKREKYRVSQRPSDGNYLYFWFFGVLSDGDRAAWELKNAMFAKAESLGLDIYAETTLPRNHEIYERFGFETYHEAEDKKDGVHFWYMRWKPALKTAAGA